MRETVLFDTHRVIKRFIASGFTEKQAEVLIEEQKSIIENNLANKQDIAETNLRIEAFRQETKKEISLLKKDIEFIKKEIAEIKKENSEIKREIASFKQETNIQIAEIKKEIASFKQETNIQIAEIKKEIALVRQEINLLEKKIVNKMYVSLFAYFGLFTTVMTGIMAVLIKFL